MGFFKQKNKRYNYKPRFYKGEGSPFDMKGKFDADRSTLEAVGGIKKRFNKVIDESKTAPDNTVKKRVYIIIAILLIIFLFIIDFDITIFF
ncbi:MAG: riboflavin synthase subunit beta [Lacinutrix sp.]|uniref:riboflavin synthase subunit beta n=1 Tax=Lacinutrix sp. TaxID=1937692 RepID=UPI0030B58503